MIDQATPPRRGKIVITIEDSDPSAPGYQEGRIDVQAVMDPKPEPGGWEPTVAQKVGMGLVWQFTSGARPDEVEPATGDLGKIIPFPTDPASDTGPLPQG